MPAPLVPSRRRAAPGSAARRGFSLIEVMVSVTLLAVVLSSLAALSLAAAKQQREVTGATYRASLMAELVNRLTVIAYGDLMAETVDQTTTTGPLPHRRQVQVSQTTPTRRQVRIIITPTSKFVKPDTVVFDRSL